MSLQDSIMAATGQVLNGERWADQWLVPRGVSLRRLVANTKEAIETNEARSRKRKRRDQASFKATVDFLIADLAASVLGCDPVDQPSDSYTAKRTALPMGRSTGAGLARYGHPLIHAKTLVHVVKACEELGLLEMTRGYRGVTSTYLASPSFIRDLQSRGVSCADIGRDNDHEELIILSRKRREELKEGVSFEPRVFTERLGYVDTCESKAMRRELLALNTQMARLDLEFIPDSQPLPDINQRRLRRHFTALSPSTPKAHPSSTPDANHKASPMFNNGGRLFGAFWLNLSRERRRASLRISGEPIAEADFSALFIRLAYRELGEELPDSLRDDPYGVQNGWPEGYRGGLKAALNAMLFTDGPLLRLPPDIVSEVPHGWTARDIREVILMAHPKLTTVFGSRIGFRLMRLESDILIAVLKRAHDEGIAALPLHDAVLVPASQRLKARMIMEQEGESIAGLKLRVDLKD